MGSQTPHHTVFGLIRPSTQVQLHLKIPVSIAIIKERRRNASRNMEIFYYPNCSFVQQQKMPERESHVDGLIKRASRLEVVFFAGFISTAFCLKAFYIKSFTFFAVPSVIGKSQYFKHFLSREVVVAQLVERLLPTPEIRSSKPVIIKFYLLTNVLKLY